MQASYALAVYLFAPLAIIVPLTVSSAVGANTIIGERERGSGEFLAHSPATEREIYLGKLLASLIPGYLAAAVGFLCYSLVVNLIVGPKVGGWFFPTANWWILMVWVLPPFIALALAVILAISARVSSAAAAQQASALVTLPLIVIAYGVASGTLFQAKEVALVIGALAWVGAAVALWRGVEGRPAGAPPRHGWLTDTYHPPSRTLGARRGMRARRSVVLGLVAVLAAAVLRRACARGCRSGSRRL